ncbi:hypothetical protein SAMN03080615_00928 [Amphritea atlantica]|uniref:Zinc protease n=1 Tax=Amphritea atlantica TaxID=355243 RepID=A0A1H9EIU1_9GAMM|nr:hypothetical protein [Amphritea atlantica]SEQ25634.1 hypothetical protein SAMN03080615_00928 [Amphritea atlantica]
MPEAKSPLFNRTYLKVIVWIVAIAIVLLTAGQNRSRDFISIQKLAESPVYYVSQDKAPYLQLRFLLRTGAAINGDQQLLQQLLLQQLQQQLAGLATQPPFSQLGAKLASEASDDRITIAVTLPADRSGEHAAIAEMTTTLLQQLSNYQPGDDLEKRWERLEAEQYLNLKDPESRLLNRFRNLLNGPLSVHPLQRFADFYRSSTSAGAMTLTLQGPDVAALAETLAPLLKESNITPSLTPTPLTPTPVQLEPVSNQTYKLWGIALPGRQQQDFLSELLAVRTLQQLLQQHQATSRLIWKSLDKQGYLAMILQGPGIKADTDLTALLESLQAQLSDELIDKARTTLQTNFDTLMEQTDSQLGMLDTIAFYQLPTDYLNSFDTRLRQTSNSQVRQTISSFLNNPGRYQITLPAY